MVASQWGYDVWARGRAPQSLAWEKQTSAVEGPLTKTRAQMQHPSSYCCEGQRLLRVNSHSRPFAGHMRPSVRPESKVEVGAQNIHSMQGPSGCT